MDYLIRMCYTDSKKDKATIKEGKKKPYLDDGNVLKASNGSSQRWQHNTKQRRGCKKTKKEEVAYGQRIGGKLFKI